jgi:hypothetical protein
LGVDLYWTTKGQMRSGYSVSVQLIGPDGALVAQQDGVPAAGKAPTNTWQPGATVLDPHSLAVPATLAPGQYRVLAILYDGASGERQRAGDGSDSVTIATLAVP